MILDPRAYWKWLGNATIIIIISLQIIIFIVHQMQNVMSKIHKCQMCDIILNWTLKYTSKNTVEGQIVWKNVRAQQKILSASPTFSRVWVWLEAKIGPKLSKNGLAFWTKKGLFVWKMGMGLYSIIGGPVGTQLHCIS